MAIKFDHEERVLALAYKEANINSKIKASTKAEDIQTCLQTGVLPNCYEGKNLSIEVQDIEDSSADLSYFIRNTDGTVTCPMGNIMTKVKSRGKSSIYQCRAACRHCPNKCGDFNEYKRVSFAESSDVVPVKMPMGSHKRYELQQLPADKAPNPGNHTLWRTDNGGKKRVVLRLKEEPDKQKLRMCTVEHPYGTIKWALGGHYFLTRGIRKTTGEMALSCLAYNMKRAINMVGTQKLIEAMQS